MKPMYDTKLFTDIYPRVDEFMQDYNSVAFPKTISDANAMTCYYLLYSKYGNSPIANLDENQFKYKLFSIIFMYGGMWEKQLEMQIEIRKLSIDDIMKGNKTIWNKALNPNTEPSTSALEEIQEINEQNVQTQKKSIADAYVLLNELLEARFNEDFIERFRICFKQFVIAEFPVLYEDDSEGDS